MYAIVTIAGQQFKVTEGQNIFVHRLEAPIGKSVTFDTVHMIDHDGGKVTIGSPTIPNARVNATVISHEQGDKVIVFKKKRRKGYRVKNGHRQQFTRINIGDILA
jgi:large subunit ribosomal protein L21